ncbi:MAG: lipocalin-like domain-containing protein [Muribaculaceae bacterium]|nr:lipocalin-like domain-containing protein [Muribaculaceae bacterium]
MRSFRIYSIITLCYILLGLASSSCRRWSHNGDIDGYWQIQTIEYFDPASDHKTVTEVVDFNHDRDDEGNLLTREYIAVGLELLQCYYGDKMHPTPAANGLINYNKKQNILIVDFRGTSSEATRRKFGIFGDPATLKIRKVDSHKLVFESSGAIVTCNRF